MRRARRKEAKRGREEKAGKTRGLLVVRERGWKRRRMGLQCNVIMPWTRPRMKPIGKARMVAAGCQCQI
jgi:hypothetical protein